VLVLIAAYLDAGRPSPSITELANRTRLRRLAVVAIVDRLRRDGWLDVERHHGRRNRYALRDGMRG
jgi:DNA-binding MarR family transcriptional regulator